MKHDSIKRLAKMFKLTFYVVLVYKKVNINVKFQYC